MVKVKKVMTIKKGIRDKMPEREELIIKEGTEVAREADSVEVIKDKEVAINHKARDLKLINKIL